VAAALLQPHPLAASSPADAVAAACARLEEIFAVPSLDGREARKERMRAIQRFIADHLDVAEMGKRTLGIHWQRWPERQAEIVAAFADFLGGFVAEIFATYGSVKIVSIREFSTVIFPAWKAGRSSTAASKRLWRTASTGAAAAGGSTTCSSAK
jgi:hypothetical protein